MTDYFTPEELQIIKNSMNDISESIGYAVDLFDLIDEWSSFVEQVSIGYNLGIEDYINELDGRDLIYDISQKCSSDVSQKISKLLAPIDEKFVSATNAMDVPWIASNSKLSNWWYRTPKAPFS